MTFGARGLGMRRVTWRGSGDWPEGGKDIRWKCFRFSGASSDMVVCGPTCVLAAMAQGSKQKEGCRRWGPWREQEGGSHCSGKCGPRAPGRSPSRTWGRDRRQRCREGLGGDFLPGPFSFLREMTQGRGSVVPRIWDHLGFPTPLGRAQSQVSRPPEVSHLGAVGVRREIPNSHLPEVSKEGQAVT